MITDSSAKYAEGQKWQKTVDIMPIEAPSDPGIQKVLELGAKAGATN
jgi:hypothetical protein